MLTVRIVDTSSTVIAEVGWTKVTVRAEFMYPGGWIVDTPYNARLLNLLEERSGDYWVIMVDHETDEFYGGPLGDIDWDGALDGVIELSGWDGNAEINSTNTLPEPANLAHPVGSTPRTDYTYDRVSQQASISLYELVDDQLNAVPSSYRQRPVSLGIASITNLGNTLALACRSPFEPLLDTVRDWSYQGGISTDFPLQGASAQFEMSMRTPVDVGFRLSETNGTPIRWNYRDSAGNLHIVNAGGAGEGVDRPVATIVGASDARWGRTVQRFVKASSATTQAELNDAGLKALEGRQAQRGLRARAVASRMGVAFRADYHLGDIVEVTFGDATYRQAITAVEIDWTRRGKFEQIETGEPPMAGQSFGRTAAPALVLPTDGISIGELSFAALFDQATDTAAKLALEIVYAPYDVSIFDTTLWAVEERIDGGAWQNARAAEAVGGGADAYYVTREFTYTLPAYDNTIELRGVLSKTGETTVYSPVLLLVDRPDVVPGQPTGVTATAVNDQYGTQIVWDRPIDAGHPDADSFQIRYREQGDAWTELTVIPVDPNLSGTSTVTPPAQDGETWEFAVRFINTAGNGPWSDTATVTYPTTNAGFTTSDGGYFTTADGGRFTTGT